MTLGPENVDFVFDMLLTQSVTFDGLIGVVAS